MTTETIYKRWPHVKLAIGEEGVASSVSAENPLPVVVVGGDGGSSSGLTDTELRASPLSIQGVVLADVGIVPVVGDFYPATQPISGTVTVANSSFAVTGPLTDVQLRAAPVPVSGTVAVTGPLTDTQLRATALPVSGPLTDTQLRASAVPISAAALPLPSGAATETTLAAISTKTPALGQAAMSASSPVVIASNQTAVPVSGPLTDAQLRNSAISVTFTNASLAVTGPLTDTQLRATAVPVSGPLTDTQMRASAVPVSGPLTDTQLRASAVPVSGPLTDTQLRAAVVPISGTVTITPPTLTKGTQGATGLSVQNLKDAGRAIVNAATAIAGVTAVTTEALLTLAISRDGAGTSNATTIAVTSGKRLRIIGVIAGVISTAAAVISARVSLRMNPGGSVAANSPILAILPLSQQAAALAQAGDTCVLMFPEAIEISGTMQVGLSQIASVTSGTIWASLIGYEY